ncbi:copper chaperone PCu(A)C [Gayadomonas joobiniege]|uniref:copper chaperone PCu(A)C n=1 Tax=Gayadomonas joobiniege TaxID=1234606 RepID=UPI0003610EF7|nr:copper chaperone PCu(A)C [Gayadomonas joobiniege]
MKKIFIAVSIYFSTMAFVYAELSVTDAKIRLLPATQSQTAAYFTLQNTGSEDITITAAASDISPYAELHTHTMQDGMAQMAQLDSVTIKAGETLHFKPGSFHLMLFSLQKNWHKLKQAQLYLYDEDRNKYQVTAQITKHISMGSGHQDHKHH